MWLLLHLPLCSFVQFHFGLYYSCEFEWQFYWRFSFSSVFPVCQILNQVISETTFQIQALKMHMLPPDRLYRMQSKLDLSWPSSCLYTVTLAFPCINWVLKNSLKNVLFWKKPQTQPKNQTKKLLTMFLYKMHVPTSNLDFFPYISCLGILSDFYKGISFMLFRRLNGKNLIF